MWLTLLLACSPPPPVVPRAAAVRTATLGSLQGLGGFTLQATIDRVVRYKTGDPQTTQVVARFSWGDADHWSLERARNGTIETRMIVFEGRGWLVHGPGAPVLQADSEPLRTQLASTWDVWTEALGAFESRMVYTPVGKEEVEGRPAERDSISLAPSDPKDRRKRAWNPTELSGDVWFDDATPARLQAQIHGIAEGEGQTMEITLLWGISNLGSAPVIAEPGTEP